MVPIIKQKAPDELTEYKNAQSGTYEDFSHKNVIRQSLLAEQNCLCAYCMSKIDNSKMKIEHFKSQKRHPELSLEYTNMLGCCMGGQGKPRKQQTCDTHKGDNELLLNPANPDDARKMQICYQDDGTIYSLNAEFDRQINKILNLNTNLLKNNRKDIIESAQKILSLRPGIRTKAELQKLIDTYTLQHKAYYGAAVYYLQKKLKTAI